MFGEGQTNDGRSNVQFLSVDSAPRRFSRSVPQHVAPTMLGVFALVSLGLLWMVNEVAMLDAAFPHNDLIFAPAHGSHAIAVRIFIISFLTAFAVTCDRSFLRRAGVFVDMVGSFLALCLFMDLMAHILLWQTNMMLSLHVIEISSGLTGFALFAFKLLERGEMPSRIRLKINTRRTRSVAMRLALVGAVAGFTAWYVASLDLWAEKALRGLTFLGGIGPGVFLFLPTFFGLLYLGARVEARMVPLPEFSPDVTVFMPAHNEAYIIAETIRDMDVSAAHYGGQVKLLVMNNKSSDATAKIAAEALAACSAMQGEVIDVPNPGKANALNAGLDAVETDFCVRVDADTQLHPNALRQAMRHFANEQVGVVGGIPLPPGGGLFDRARFLEVAVKHGFYSVAFETIDSVVGIPGMFSAYRTEIPRQLGGFVEGMNGEDTDISLRAGEMGYRLVVDPKVKYTSEVPATYNHMREQRTRWFRSTFHISSRCRDLIFSRHATVRGKVVLPYMLINSARRAMMVPLLMFGFIEYVTPFNSFNTLIWQSIIAVVVGAPALMAVFCAFLMKSPRSVLFLPEYLVFRLMRAYFTLESMLSINIRAFGEHPYSISALSRPTPKSTRVA